MRLFDTAKNTYVELKVEPIFRMYVCGITPYDSAHLGHVFTFMTYDLLQRRLEDLGHEVRMVRNITDVDEPIYEKAKELNVHYTALAQAEAESFAKVMDRLYFRPLFAEPKASEYIDKMADAVKQLLDKGFAYYLEGDVYFDVSKYPAFGTFSGFSDRLLYNFMKDRGGDPKRKGKHGPLDFLLWRSVMDPQDPAQWDSVVGNGRPGWHIECTAMSSDILGIPFDLHGGGTDLIFPHHECEIAQSEGLGRGNPAATWMHVSPMLYAGEKMSKSLGNLVFAKDLLRKHDPAVIRLALMYYHHRTGGEWQPELLDEATELLQRVHETNASVAAAQQFLDEVRSALDDDLNTPAIVETLRRFVGRTTTRKSAGNGQEVVNQTLSLIGLLPA
jgi:L-cysteine:1D-myo-inositol 2-amino-2-deoxy-alpha-D-glucopyranoside ligase